MNTALSRLYWKEFRQLMPVLLTICAMGLLLFLLRLLIGTAGSTGVNVAQICHLVLFLMPCMYAIGAAAILISQEKEQRTMQWMQSMPINPSRIVITKAVVALAGFLAISFLSWLLLLPLSDEATWRADAFGNLTKGYVSNDAIGFYGLACYLLIAACAASWRTSTLVRSILLLILLSILPKVLESAVLWSILKVYPLTTFSPEHENNIFALAFVLPVGLVLTVLGYRWGVTSMRPNLSIPNTKLTNTVSSWQPIAGIQWLSRDRMLTWRSAMIWQTLRQFGWPVLAASCVMLVLMSLFAPPSDVDNVYAFLICGWLGFLGGWTFQSDASHKRMRFLSDRGVTGGKIWWYRVGIMLLIVLGTTMVGFYHSREWRILDKLSPLEGICFVLFVYAMAQWSGQLAYSMVLAVIQTPAFLIFGVSYLVFTYFQLQAPIPVIVAMLALPFLVTRLAMQNWVDGLWNFRFWMTHVVGLVCWIMLPLSMALYHYITLPHMDSSVQSELLAEANRWSDHQKPAHIGAMLFNGYPESGEQITSSTERLETHVIKNLHEIKFRINPVKTTERALAIDARTLSRLHTLATMTSHFSQHPVEVSSDWTSHFRSTIEIFVDLIPRVRNCNSIIQQDNADVLEILLLMHLKAPGNKDLLNQFVLNQCKQIFLDRDSRQAARRRAVAVSWKQSAYKKEYNAVYAELGGYLLGPFNGDYKTAGLSDRMINSSRLDQITQSLWKMANSSGSDDREVIELANLCHIPKSNAIAPVRAMNLDNYLVDYPETFSLPAAQWNANWEQIAEKFAKEELTNE